MVHNNTQTIDGSIVRIYLRFPSIVHISPILLGDFIGKIIHTTGGSAITFHWPSPKQLLARSNRNGMTSYSLLQRRRISPAYNYSFAMTLIGFIEMSPRNTLIATEFHCRAPHSPRPPEIHPTGENNTQNAWLHSLRTPVVL